ncbi:MAG: hypothetical protein IT430_04735 [Phycisphaerales bacterium]|nr:hypothetical protein [Phycisphaerales bacterium]
MTALTLPGLSQAIMAGPFEQPDGISHFVPADKKLAAEWVAALTQRGQPRVCRGDDLKYIGMPVGGVAAGQLYLLGDGTLGCWQIFNQQYFSGYGRDNYDLPPAASPIEQGFAIVIDDGGTNTVRRLSSAGFRSVEFAGRYPIADVHYAAADCPAKVHLEAFSPFIPLNAPDSTLPATIFNLTVRNTSNRTVAVGVLTWLENAICHHNGKYLRAQRVGRVESRKGRGAIVHSMRPLPKPAQPIREPIVLADFEGADYGNWRVEGPAFGAGPSHGTLANQQRVSGFQGQGLVNTFLGGDGPTGRLTSPEFEISRHYLNFMIGGGDHKGQTCINLLVNGKVVRTSTGRNQELLRWDSWDVRELAGSKAAIEIVDAHSGGWGHINIDHIELADESRFGPSGPLEELDDYGTMTLMYDGPFVGSADVARSASKLGGVAAPISDRNFTCDADVRRSIGLQADSVELEPGAAHTFTFVLAWHFPNRSGVGQQYASRFADAAHVATDVFDHSKRLTEDTRLWVKTFYEDSTLPWWLLDRLHSTVCNLATGTTQWWKSGRFWAWEGVGCCSGTCTHVWNYEHAMARLLPELERSVRENQDLGAALHEDGLVGFRGERNNAYAADGQAGTVLKCYREHLMSPDDAFLKRNWPNIKNVLLYSITQDGNDDGLIESSQHNTYDINFFGPNTFVGSLYLAALRAGEEMARLMGEIDFAHRLHRIFENGRDLSVKQLYNGEYFIQQVDLAAHPRDQYGQGCLSDQLFGQGWAHQLGLGPIYPPELVLTALQSIWKYNWAPDVRPQNEAHHPERWFARPGDAGLFTCTWPKSEYLAQGVRYREEVWTGIEYQVAGHMIWDGLLREGLAICRAIHDRYHPSRRNPFNEVECGDHYARALASWGVYLALCGFEYDGPRGHIGFAPRLAPENFKAAFTAAEGWGSFAQTNDAQGHRVAIDMRWGQLQLSSVAIAQPEAVRQAKGRPVAMINDRMINMEMNIADGRIHIQFDPQITLEAGQRLEIQLA